MIVKRETEKQVDVRTKAEQYQIWDNNNKFKGSLYINKAKLVWCQGRTQEANGKKIAWEEFISYMESSK